MAAKWPNNLNPQERIALAEAKIGAMLDRMINLVHLHECNRIIFYSKTLSSQIPRSYAGVAYRVFASTMLSGEMTSICTFWDSCRAERNSIPTVAALVDDDAVKSLLYDRKINAIKNGRQLSAENNDPEMLAWITNLSDRDAESFTEGRRQLLADAITKTREFQKTDLLKAVRDFRDINLAHNLSDNAKKFPELATKYGDERHLIEFTQPLLEDFNLGVRNSGFDWDSTKDMARRNASALWNGCKIEVLE